MSPFQLHLGEIARITDGQLMGEDRLVTGVSIDTRTLTADNLYIAIKGAHFDGHHFVPQAKEKLASAALVSEQQDVAIPQVIVNDTKIALGQIAAYHRRQFSLPILCMTGSCGKTTVKEIVASVLRQKSSVLATKGNLNNDLGVPLTLLGLSKEHDYGVIELGANHIGEIAYTAGLALPDVSLVTIVAPAHLEGFGSVEGVFQAKSEIYDGLDSHGVAVINLDDAFSAPWLIQNQKRKTLTYSLHHPADVSALNRTLDAQGRYEFLLSTPQGQIDIHSPLLGEHNVSNILAATAMLIALNISLDQIKAGVEAMDPVPGRLNAKISRHGAVVIDDTYNANPKAVMAAVDVLTQAKGKKYLLMGDMGEMGDDVRAYHFEVGQYAKQCGIDAVLAFGQFSESVQQGFGPGGQHYSSKAELIRACAELDKPDATFLVKGSRSSKMEEVVNALVT